MRELILLKMESRMAGLLSGLSPPGSESVLNQRGGLIAKGYVVPLGDGLLDEASQSFRVG